MKRKIHIVLPIVLALLLPGLSFYTFEVITFSHQPRFYLLWATSSFFLYNLWYLLWYLWELKREYRNPKYLLKLLLFAVGSIGIVTWGILNDFQEFHFSHVARTSLGLFLFLAIQYTLKAQENISQLQVEKEQIQTENYKTQLQVLHAKIDPHFLFNSLNTLRSMVRQSNSNSEQFILSLSDFYRQTLKYNENTRLQLSEELTVLESYLFLMKNRNEDAVFVDITIDQSLYSRFLPTLALQIVVENCFKHNSMTSNMPLHIDISNTDDGYIEVTNNIQPKIGAIESTGYGLDTLTKRYELMNISKGILVEQSPDQFLVKLKLLS
ncbi:MAG: histidine kinase [Bacteroidota bacterium]